MHEAPLNMKGRAREDTGVYVVVGSKSLDLVHSQLPKFAADVLQARTVTKHGERALASVRERQSSGTAPLIAQEASGQVDPW